MVFPALWGPENQYLRDMAPQTRAGKSAVPRIMNRVTKGLREGSVPDRDIVANINIVMIWRMNRIIIARGM